LNVSEVPFDLSSTPRPPPVKYLGPLSTPTMVVMEG